MSSRQRGGNSFTLFVSPHLGGGQVQPTEGGVRSSRGGGQVQPGGSGPAGGGELGPAGGSGPARGGSGPAGGGGGGSGQAGGGSGPAGGGGVRSSRWGRGGQHLAPSCRRYASCVHAGGLSCFKIFPCKTCLRMTYDMCKTLFLRYFG